MAGKGTREISVFVDESGSFDPDAKSSQFYLVCMVFHDQDVSIAENVAALNVGLREIGLAEDHAVHAGPLIRWESPYRNLRRQDRRVVFAKMLAFLRRTDVTYRCFPSTSDLSMMWASCTIGCFSRLSRFSRRMPQNSTPMTS